MNDEKIINPWNDKYAKYYNKLLLSNPTKKFDYKRVDYIVTIQRELNDWEILMVDWGRHKLIRGHANFDEDFAMVVDDSADNDLLEKAKQFQLDGEYEPAKGTDIIYIFNQEPTYEIYPANEGEIGLYLINGTYYKCEEVEGELQWVKVFEMAEMSDIKQSDWNQSDDTQIDFIKNRTHYLGELNLLPEQVYVEETTTNLYFNLANELVQNEKVCVKLGDVERQTSDAISGDSGMTGFSFPDCGGTFKWNMQGITDAPNNENAYISLYTSSATGQELKLYQKVVAKQLDEKYIPSTIVRQSAIESLDSTATIASESDDIVTIKNGLVQTDGLVENNEENDIVLAKVAKTGSFSDLTDKPTIPSQGVQNIVDGSKIGSTRTTSSAEETGGYSIGYYAHTEGYNTKAAGSAAHAEGYDSIASGSNSHAESQGEASGTNSHAEGQSTASGSDSHAEGQYTSATALGSHSEGAYTSATGTHSHAEGGSTSSSGIDSHAEGDSTTASGDGSHAEGKSSTASGRYSHAEGNGTVANHRSQHVFGEFNTEDPSTAASTAKGNYIETVGNGTADDSRSNARTLDWSGNEIISGNESIGGMLRIGSTSTGGVLLKFDSGDLKISFDNGDNWSTVTVS